MTKAKEGTKEPVQRHKEGQESSTACDKLLNDPTVKYSFGDNNYAPFDSGLDLEVFGSYAAKLSTK